MEQVYEKPCTHKINKKKDENINFSADLSQRQKELLRLKEKTQTDFQQ